MPEGMELTQQPFDILGEEEVVMFFFNPQSKTYSQCKKTTIYFFSKLNSATPK